MFEGRCGVRVGVYEVGGDGALDVSCDVPLEAADDFFAGVSEGESAGHVVLGRPVPAEPGDAMV